MSWFDRMIGRKTLDESIKAFIGKGDSILTDKQAKARTGEGIEDLINIGYGATSIDSFNMFYNKYINKSYENEYKKILEYRKMAEYPEIADVIEDATNESTEEDNEGKIFTLDIIDNDIAKNKNICDTLFTEFDDLFNNRFNINEKIWDLFRSYMIDGRLYYERIINLNNKKNGIIDIKKLPSETMDYTINSKTGIIISYYQYLKRNIKRPLNAEEAEESKDIIVFNPEQIGFINHQMYGPTKHNIFGYLEKSRIPYNQLKLLETSVIIYRIVRSPERFVFKIDVGNMPKDKAMKFVDKVKTRFIKKQTYNSSTGSLTQEPEILSLLENFFIPTCLSLSTKIEIEDNKSLSLSDIVSDFNNGIDHKVKSVDQKTGEIIAGEIEWAGITRKDTEVIRVWFENDKYIDCTPDHKFLVWSDEGHTEMIEIEAKDLTEEMDIVDV